MRILKSLWVIPAALLFGIPASAHHSFDATYYLDQEIKIEGKVIQVLIRNPHSFLHVEALDDHGVMQRWALEWQHGSNRLAKQGIQRGTLKPGDEVIVVMNPGRRPDD